MGELEFHFLVVNKMKMLNYQQSPRPPNFYSPLLNPLYRIPSQECNAAYISDEQKTSCQDPDDLR